jgi:5-methyltetrahydropteroyltriglutamate--homocysteine methyltransferase
MTRILTTHAGSLPRPLALTGLYARSSQGGHVDPVELAEAGKAALTGILQSQADAGVDIANNGEQQREAFFLYLRHRLSGIGGRWERKPQADVAAYPDFQAAMAAANAEKTAVSNFQPPKTIGPIAHEHPEACVEECADFASALKTGGHQFAATFLTAPSPGIVAAALKNEHYDSEEAYLDALAAALRVEYETILRNGHMLQLDCPELGLEGHVTYAGQPAAHLKFVERAITAIAKGIDGLPKKRIRLHLCWGNYEAPHDQDTALADLWPIVKQAPVGGFVLPFANPRHAHEWRVLKASPPAPDQTITAGVIDTLTNFVEHEEVVADRIELVARAIDDPARITACTDCGFDTSAGMGRVAPSVVWAKLRAMTTGAKLASGRLGLDA